MKWLLCVAFGCVLQAEDAGLTALRNALVPLRAQKDERLEVHGATSQLTVVKHLLRDWIESKLQDVDRIGANALAVDLNRALQSAGLQCSGSNNPCETDHGLNELGFVGVIKLSRGWSFLAVQTGVGVQCGEDQSAYAYEPTAKSWRRRWQSEQNDYREKKYTPQTIHSVEITEFSKQKRYLILTLGSEMACSSNWHPVYYRLWRLSPELAEPRLLLDRSQMAFFAHDPPIRGSVGEDDALIEYAAQSVDLGDAREAVQHFKVVNGVPERVDPVALHPRDFVDEWLARPWREMAKWSETRSLETEHRELSKKPGVFVYPTMHCQTPDLWQVSTSAPTYFLVRWRPPYRFTMTAVSDHPWPKCTEKDPQADEPRTLFAGWH